MLRCLKVTVTLVSLRFKNKIRTPSSYVIIRIAERQLLNERISCINNKTLTPAVLKGIHVSISKHVLWTQIPSKSLRFSFTQLGR